MRARHAVPLLLSLALAAGVEVKPTASELPLADTVLFIQNEFVKIFVNTEEFDTGRFAVDTTGGDPARPNDDNQYLIYGHPKPWTSYTTVQIDGTDYAFGGKTRRRAGLSAQVGTLFKQPALTADGAIEAVTAFGDIVVTQRLSLARGPSTRMLDSAAIEYEIENTGATEHTVGLRILIDTMLGTNDGAPLRAGTEAITSERCFTADLPEYFQAFDLLSSPAVISQGTLAGEGLTPPDSMWVANWGTLADEPWTMECVAGRSLVRKGERELDSAVALYWNPRALRPGEKKWVVRTLYGLGGITTSPGKLMLGLTLPVEVAYKPHHTPSFTMMGYLENTGGFLSRNTRLVLHLPPGLSLVSGDETTSLGDLQGGAGYQAAWRVVPNGKAYGLDKVALEALSDSYESNEAARDIFIHPPPTLKMTVTAPDHLTVKEEELENNPFEVRLKVENNEATPVHELILRLTPPDGVILPPPEQASKYIPVLESGGAADVHWKVKAEEGLGDIQLKLSAESDDIYPTRQAHAMFIPAISPRLSLSPAQASAPEGGYFFVDLNLERVSHLSRGNFEIAYDADSLRLIRLSEGTIAFRSGYRMLGYHSEPGKFSLGFEVNPKAALEDREILVRLHFKALKAGTSKAGVDWWKLSDEGKSLDLPFRGATITIY